MFHLSIPWWELVLRSVVVYGFMLTLLRLSGKRQVGQLAPFDLVLLLVLSNAVQNSMNGGDASLVGGMLSAVTLVSLNFFMGVATSRSKKIERLVEGVPQTLIRKGVLDQRAMAAADLTCDELDAALRLGGCEHVEEVYLATLENNGAISVLAKRDHPAPPDTPS